MKISYKDTKIDDQQTIITLHEGKKEFQRREVMS
jgi:hypothetical protein